jgi:hypothetical protein
MTLVSNLEEANLEDGGIDLECLEAEILADGTHDVDHETKRSHHHPHPPPLLALAGFQM